MSQQTDLIELAEVGLQSLRDDLARMEGDEYRFYENEDRATAKERVENAERTIDAARGAQ